MWLIIILFLTVGCSEQTTTEEKFITKIQKGDITSYADLLTAEDFEEDIDGDGQKERITLNISPAPQPHPENEYQYLWDSSHVFQLIVEDEGDYFTLFDDHVQGLAEMYVVSEEENQFSIVFFQKGTSLTLTVFRYKGDYFEKEVVYSSGLMNNRSTFR
jgi:hypothetical protein